MKEPRFIKHIPWKGDINDRMKVSQNHIHLARSVKQKLFYQGRRLCHQRVMLREGLED